MDLIVLTRTCPHCHKTYTINVSSQAYVKWQSGTLVQDAFPNMTPGEREQLITGYHDSCFEEAFAPNPQEEALWDAYDSGTLVGKTINWHNLDRKVVEVAPVSPRDTSKWAKVRLSHPVTLPDGSVHEWVSIADPGTVLITGADVE